MNTLAKRRAAAVLLRSAVLAQNAAVLGLVQPMRAFGLRKYSWDDEQYKRNRFEVSAVD